MRHPERVEDYLAHIVEAIGGATLRFLGRVLWGAAARAVRLWIWVVDATIAAALWPLRNPQKTVVRNGFWRFLTVISVGYLVFDRVYETSATISAPASDPRDPFMFPFLISNSSHLFALRNVRWLCDIDELAMNRKPIIEARVGLLAQEPPHDIPPGAVLNVSCRDRVKMPAGRITSLTVDIELVYDVDIYLWSWRKHPSPANFHWYPDASNAQWIRGDVTH